MQLNSVATTKKWVTLHCHRAWLYQQADDLLSFFETNSRNPIGGFFDLDDDGKPLLTPGSYVSQIHITTRMIHCFAAAYLLGRPGSDAIIDHGMRFLWSGHRDSSNGGYYWSVNSDGPVDDTKQAYGHAFVLLAASSAKVAGHPDADRILTDVSTVIEEHFWEDSYGASAEHFSSDWHPLDPYRGQNSNMHLTEAVLPAFEATGSSTYLRMAERIADLIIRQHTAPNGWRLPEHFTPDWQPNKEYSGSPIFRPYGTTPGHWLEWSRLLLQLSESGDRKLSWLPEAAKNLFHQAASEGWDHENGGFYYTLEWDGLPRIRDRYWWPCCEGISAAAFLNSFDSDAFYESWYRRIWNFSAAHFIDRDRGGWRPLPEKNPKSSNSFFAGKPDL